MGLFSSGKSTSRSGSAQKWAKPFAKAAAGTVQSVVDANAGGLQQLTNQVQGLVPGLISKFNEGNAGVDAAGGYVTDVLGGKYLNGNPHLEGMIGLMQDNVTDRVGAAYGSRGSFGGTAWTEALAGELANAELGLRYGNYSDEMGRMAGAAGLAPSIAQGEYAGIQEILGSAGLGAEIPYAGINALSGGLANLFSGGKSTQKGPGFGSQLLAAGAQAAGAYAGAQSDRRSKKNIEKVGEFEDGLGIYTFQYKHDPNGTTFKGVMADEVKELRPQAYIEDFNGTGMAGVNYAAL